LEQLHKYLQDKHIRIKLNGDDYSHAVTSNMSSETLFDLDYLVIDGQDRRKHYEKISELTNTTVSWMNLL
jgi:hypothetical protein